MKDIMEFFQAFYKDFHEAPLVHVVLYIAIIAGILGLFLS